MLRDTHRNRKPVRGKRRNRFRITRLEERIAPAPGNGKGPCDEPPCGRGGR